jgi:hypothetical protein
LAVETLAIPRNLKEKLDFSCTIGKIELEVAMGIICKIQRKYRQWEEFPASEYSDFARENNIGTFGHPYYLDKLVIYGFVQKCDKRFSVTDKFIKALIQHKMFKEN